MDVSVDDLVRDLATEDDRAREAYVTLASQPLAATALLERLAFCIRGGAPARERGLVADLVMMHRRAADEPTLLELAADANPEAAADAARALVGGTPTAWPWLPADRIPRVAPASLSTLAHLARGLDATTPYILALPLARACAITDPARLVSMLHAESCTSLDDVHRLKAMIAGVAAAPSRPLLDAVCTLAAGTSRTSNAEWQASIQRDALTVALDDPPSLVRLLIHGDAWARREVLARLRQDLATPAQRPAILTTLEQARAAIADTDLARQLDRLAVAVRNADRPLPPVRVESDFRAHASSEGGPMLVVPGEARTTWHGVHAGGVDYDRAVAAAEKGAGVVEVDGRVALALGHTAVHWLPVARVAGGMLVMEGSAEDVYRYLVPAATAAHGGDGGGREGDGGGDGPAAVVSWTPLGTVEVGRGGLVAFDAAHAGARADGRATIKLAAGHYDAALALIDDERGWIWVVRLAKAAASETPPAKAPATKKPAAKQPAAKKPAAKKPAAKKPTARKPGAPKKSAAPTRSAATRKPAAPKKPAATKQPVASKKPAAKTAASKKRAARR